MGRKTFQSIGRPLDGRVNIVVTRGPAIDVPGVVTVGSLGAALQCGEDAARSSGATEVMVIGGADVYAQSLDAASRIYLTIVHATPVGDTYFPHLGTEWREVAREPIAQTPKDEHAATLTVLERSHAAASSA